MATMFCEYVKPNRYKCGDVVEYKYDGGVHNGMVIMSKLTLVGYTNTVYKLIRIHRINDNMRNSSNIRSALSGSTLVLQDNIFREVEGDNNNG